MYKYVTVFKYAYTYQIDCQVAFEKCIWLTRSDGACL